MSKDNIFISNMHSNYQVNLIDKILCNIQENNQPGIVVDYSGELIQKHYDQGRGDIIFNSSHAKSSGWDFLADCRHEDEIGDFFNRLIQYSTQDNTVNIELRDISNMKIIFIDSINFLRETGSFSFKNLKMMLVRGDHQEILQNLAGKKSIKVLNNTKNDLIPALLRLITYIPKLEDFDTNQQNSLFSINNYFESLKQGSNAYLFLGLDSMYSPSCVNNLKIIIDMCLGWLSLHSHELDKQLYFIFDRMNYLSKIQPITNTLGIKNINFVMPFLSISELPRYYGEIEGNLMFKEFNKYFFCEYIDPISMDILKNHFNDINQGMIPLLSNEEECFYLEHKTPLITKKLHLKELDGILKKRQACLEPSMS